MDRYEFANFLTFITNDWKEKMEFAEENYFLLELEIAKVLFNLHYSGYEKQTIL